MTAPSGAANPEIAPERQRSHWRWMLGQYGFLLIALVIECVVFEVMAQHKGLPKSFLSPDSILNILNRSAVYGVVSVGMTFVILMGGIDLSVGSMIALGAVVSAMVVKGMGEPVVAALIAGYVVALLIGVAAGSVTGFFVTVFDIPPFIATLGIMSSARGLAYVLSDGRSVAPLPVAFAYLGRHRVGESVPVAVIVMLVVFVIGAMLLSFTRFGRHVRAIGGNEEAARLSGIPVRRVKWMVYVLCSCLAVGGAILASSKLGVGDPNLGVGDELGIIAAVVVGGTSLSGGRGTIGGTFVGLLLISVLASGLNFIGVGTFAQQLVLGVVILAAVLLDRLRPTA